MSTDQGSCVPSASAPTSQAPFSFSISSARFRFCGRATAMRARAPDEALYADALHGAERSAGTTRSSAPKAKAARAAAGAAAGVAAPGSAEGGSCAQAALDLLEQLRRGRRGIGRGADGAADDDVVRAVSHRLLGGRGPRLVVGAGARVRGPDAR